MKGKTSLCAAGAFVTRDNSVQILNYVGMYVGMSNMHLFFFFFEQHVYFDFIAFNMCFCCLIVTPHDDVQDKFPL